MYCCGTARSNRKRYPAALKKVHLDIGQHKAQTVGGVHCFVWKDKKNIDFIQTICDPSETRTIMSRNKDDSRTVVSCLLSVKIYNEKMGGVDLADSKRQVYSYSRSRRSGGTDFSTTS